jgi:hypothetical protein
MKWVFFTACVPVMSKILRKMLIDKITNGVDDKLRNKKQVLGQVEIQRNKYSSYVTSLNT